MNVCRRMCTKENNRYMSGGLRDTHCRRSNRHFCRIISRLFELNFCPKMCAVKRNSSDYLFDIADFKQTPTTLNSKKRVMSECNMDNFDRYYKIFCNKNLFYSFYCSVIKQI